MLTSVTVIGLTTGAQAVTRTRPDLIHPLTDQLCARQALTPRRLWRAGVYDAQLLAAMRPAATRAASTQPAARSTELAALPGAAAALATRQGRGGAAWGICKDGRTWIAASHAPRPLIASKTKGTWILPLAALRRCRDWSLTFAGRLQGTKTIKHHRDRFSTESLGDGTVALTCLPQAASRLGPQLWYLLPTRNGPAPNPPEHETLKDSRRDQAATSLFEWINAVRKNAALKSLKRVPANANDASVPAAKPNNLDPVAHDRAQLARARSRLRRHNQQLLGENRVAASSLEQLAWLLWNSARHRELLLNQQATHVSLSLRRSSFGLTSVMMLTRSL